MALSEWLSLVACGGTLTLGFLVLLRRAPRNPLALPLGLLCLDMFVWNFASLAYHVSNIREWYWLNVAFSAYTPPLALHVILAFVGRLRPLRWLLVASYLGFGLLSISAAAAFILPAAQRWAGSSTWSLIYVSAWIPLLVLKLVLLMRHLGETQFNPDEQMRTRLIMASLLVGAVLGSTEIWDDILAIPALGHLGALGSMTLVAMGVLRFRLFGRELSSSIAVYSLALAALGVFGYLAVFRWFGTNTALLVLGTFSITLGLLAAARDAVTVMMTRRGRSRQLAMLGRFSAQMAHDLKNPLAALKGAVQYLDQEATKEGANSSTDEQHEFLELMAEQVGRIERALDRYQRLSRVEPVFGKVEVNQLVEGVVSSTVSIKVNGISAEVELDTKIALCLVDQDLLVLALENVVRNALEAMPEGGVLTVSTKASTINGGGEGVSISVSDTGCGMNARQRERAFDDFYTTKAEGSGLGLAFVRRVVEAHGGEVKLISALGKGTTVRIELPCTPVTVTRAGGSP